MGDKKINTSETTKRKILEKGDEMTDVVSILEKITFWEKIN